MSFWKVSDTKNKIQYRRCTKINRVQRVNYIPFFISELVLTHSILVLIYFHQYRENISSRFSRNSDANASEFLENLENMFTVYYMNKTTLFGVTRCEERINRNAYNPDRLVFFFSSGVCLWLSVSLRYEADRGLKALMSSTGRRLYTLLFLRLSKTRL